MLLEDDGVVARVEVADEEVAVVLAERLRGVGAGARRPSRRTPAPMARAAPVSPRTIPSIAPPRFISIFTGSGSVPGWSDDAFLARPHVAVRDDLEAVRALRRLHLELAVLVRLLASPPRPGARPCLLSSFISNAVNCLDRLLRLRVDRPSPSGRPRASARCGGRRRCSATCFESLVAGEARRRTRTRRRGPWERDSTTNFPSASETAWPLPFCVQTLMFAPEIGFSSASTTMPLTGDPASTVRSTFVRLAPVVEVEVVLPRRREPADLRAQRVDAQPRPSNWNSPSAPFRSRSDSDPRRCIHQPPVFCGRSSMRAPATGRFSWSMTRPAMTAPVLSVIGTKRSSSFRVTLTPLLEGLRVALASGPGSRESSIRAPGCRSS